jgi:hypothetical protein
MSDEHNPYAAPRAIVDNRPPKSRLPARPWLTRLLTIGLMLNGLSFPLAIGITEVYDRSRARGFRFLTDLVENGASAFAVWVLIAWPIVSLFATIYTPLVDRHTKSWQEKTTIAAAMFLLWIPACMTLYWIVSNWQ